VAAEIIWSGAIGDVVEAHVSTSPGTHPTALKELPPEEAVPDTLDWDHWLGSASTRSYSSYYVPYNWRGFYDFGTGQIGNWATHTAGPVHHALQLGAPTSVECVGQVGPSSITFPTHATIRLDFPARGEMPPVKVFYHDSARSDDPDVYHVPGMDNETILPPSNNLTDKGRPMGGGGRGQAAAGAAPARSAAPRALAPDGQPAGAGGAGVRVFGSRGASGAKPGILTGNGAVFIGTKGIMATCSRGEGVWLLPAARWKEYVLPHELLTRSPGHMLDWIRACKGGNPGCSDFSIAGPYAEWLALAAIAFRVSGRLEWDSVNTRFTNNADANKFVKPVFRKGRELKL
jgi:hypothetical protein